jgi:hypothetical protein
MVFLMPSFVWSRTIRSSRELFILARSCCLATLYREQLSSRCSGVSFLSHLHLSFAVWPRRLR